MLAGDFIAYILISTKIMMIMACMVFLISGLDDLFIDLCYIVRAIYRRLFIFSRCRRLREQDLLDCPEKPIAVMVPAWDESAVIRPMLTHMAKTLNYRNVHIFVGTYPNDGATGREVDRVRDEFAQVHQVVTGHDGPTNKADCLNWIYQGIRAYERSSGVRFEIFVMQDCEDVVHPLCYKLFNFLIPRFDMVQLPVHSLPRKWHEFTGSHYKDEFAQLHHKDLVVREVLGRSIPAAGVGCAFSRRAFETVAKSRGNQVFSIDSLTEDYDLGFRLREFGLRQAFVRFSVPRTVTRKSMWTGKPRQVVVDELVCIREYFPARFYASVKQKSRWVLGIALQGWEHLGWRGDLRTKYMLFRDRKALVTNLVNLVGYAVVAVVSIIWLAIWLDPTAYRYPPLLERGSVLWYVVIANALLLGWRLAFRAYCVGRVYGWQQALLSVPRTVWSNIINFGATCRAIRLYARYLRTGKLIAWDKTAHDYPDSLEPHAGRRKLGDLLLERQIITLAQLNEALSRQSRDRRLLGRILVEMGVVQDTELSEVLKAA